MESMQSGASYKVKRLPTLKYDHAFKGLTIFSFDFRMGLNFKKWDQLLCIRIDQERVGTRTMQKEELNTKVTVQVTQTFSRTS